MYVSGCVYESSRVCMCEYMCVLVYISESVWMDMCESACVCVCKYVMCVCVYMSVYVCVCMPVSMYFSWYVCGM